MALQLSHFPSRVFAALLLSAVLSSCGSRNFKSQTFSSTSTIQPTFTSLNAKLFQSKCVTCHGVHDGSGEESLNGYSAVRLLVRPGQPEQSKLYKEVASGNMPVLLPSLSDDEVLAVYQWIANGANND